MMRFRNIVSGFAWFSKIMTLAPGNKDTDQTG